MLGFGLGLNKWRRVGGGYVGLLDLFPNAAAAYSLRKLRAAYSGAAVRVRKEVSLVSEEIDIGFDANGNLDTTALLSFASNADNGDVFVSIWYDQTQNDPLNQNNATQSLAVSQPKIVSAGSLVTENGKVAIQFDGVNDRLQSPSNWTTGDSTTLHVLTVNDVSIRVLLGSYYNAIFFNEKQVAFDGSSWNQSTNAVSLGQNLLEYTYFNSGADIKYFNNGSANGSSTLSGTQQINNNIGSFTPTNSTYSFDGKYQELIHFASDQSSNRTGIETNINNFYSIY